MVHSGFLVVDKQEGITSHDLINRARRVLGTRKIGHAGTLDPMATGVMVLGVESATRLLDYVMSGRKRYLATIKMGILTHTDDRMGDVTSSHVVDEVAMDQAVVAFNSMVGRIEQIPSKVSAIKVDGKRSYDRVRSGEEVELKARTVEIFDLSIIDRRSDEFDIDVTCSPGTYIRAIARDVGGHLTALRRIESAPFALSDCGEIDPSSLISPYEVMHRVLASYPVSEAQCRELSLGRSIEFDSSTLMNASAMTAGAQRDVITAVSEERELVALLKRVDDRLQPFVVLPECFRVGK